MAAIPTGLYCGWAQKSGTTSLFRYLRAHPQISPSLKKEVNYFGGRYRPHPDQFDFGEKWYRSQFPLKRKGQQVFEASANYMNDPRVPARMHALLPNAKLIFLLKDPVERAISHYYQSVRRETDPLEMAEAFRGEEERLQPFLQANDYHAYELNHYSYLYRSRCGEQIARFLEYYPRDQLLIIKSEEFFCDPQAVLRRIFDFLGVDPEFKLKEFKVFHANPKNFGAEEGLKNELREYFKPHNEDLAQLLGEDFSW